LGLLKTVMLLLLVVLLLPQSITGAVPSVIFGPWYYIADGFDVSHVFNPEPSWINNAGNWISLAFLNPSDFTGKNPVPTVFNSTSSYFNKLGKTVFYSIGGYGYAGNWNWLSNADQSTSAGKLAATVALNYSVGIEIDYEGGADPTIGIQNFINGFRSVCPMGKCMLTMDLYGSPGGQFWQSNVVPKILPPNGKPGDVYGNGNYVDYVNIMVIDGQPVSEAEVFWQQWFSTGYLTTTRATFGLIAGYPGLGFCSGDQSSQSMINDAVNFLKPYNTYGITSWAVCPPASGQLTTCADWDPNCNANAPGFQYLCTQLNSCK